MLERAEHQLYRVHRMDVQQVGNPVNRGQPDADVHAHRRGHPRNPIPSLVSVSESASRLNVGAARDGESPFGIRSSVSVQFRDILWNDHVGDFYLSQRSGTRGGFWQKWSARNLYFSNMSVTVYEGIAARRWRTCRSACISLRRLTARMQPET